MRWVSASHRLAFEVWISLLIWLSLLDYGFLRDFGSLAERGLLAFSGWRLDDMDFLPYSARTAIMVFSRSAGYRSHELGNFFDLARLWVIGFLAGLGLLKDTGFLAPVGYHPKSSGE